MTRERLPNRRANATRKVTWMTYGGDERTVLVTFGFRSVTTDAEQMSAVTQHYVAEVFCADFKSGSDQLGIVTDTCILISRLFQMGERPGILLASMCEPYSLIGTILKAAVDEEANDGGSEECMSGETAKDVPLKPASTTRPFLSRWRQLFFWWL